jgi:hypothetical protein
LKLNMMSSPGSAVGCLQAVVERFFYFNIDWENPVQHYEKKPPCFCAAGQKELSASTKASLLNLLADPAAKRCVEPRVRRGAQHVMLGSLEAVRDAIAPLAIY